MQNYNELIIACLKEDLKELQQRISINKRIGNKELLKIDLIAESALLRDIRNLQNQEASSV